MALLTQKRREYPVADDRGGIPEDFDNYVKFLSRLRDRLNSSGRRWGLSITLVCNVLNLIQHH